MAKAKKTKTVKKVWVTVYSHDEQKHIAKRVPEAAATEEILATYKNKQDAQEAADKLNMV